MLTKVCHSSVFAGPTLQPLTGKQTQDYLYTMEDGARADISTHELWGDI